MTNVCVMQNASSAKPLSAPVMAWVLVALAGIAAPIGVMLLVLDSGDPARLETALGPILAIALMAIAMIAAAAAGRFAVGIALGLMGGIILVAIAESIGMPSLPHPLSTGLVLAIACISFAARGALFARSASDKGWWIAVFVVAGEAAILLTALAEPDALPDWLLVLLPAQWANIAIHSTLTGTGTYTAIAALIALGGTAAATLLVARLWPRRWPYLIMFTAWLALSALVYRSL